MSMQINLQYVFKMSASRTHACIGTSLAYTRPTFSLQRDRHGVRRSFKTRLHRVVVFSRAGGENKRFYYRDVLLSADVEVIAVIRQISGNEFVFQQVSAPAHRARETMGSYVERRAGLYFTGTVATEQSRDLNPVDYKIWATMQQRFYQTKIRNVDELRQRLLNVWSSIKQDVIDALHPLTSRVCMRAFGRQTF